MDGRTDGRVDGGMDSCKRLARLKVKLTNQDSAGRIHLTVLTSIKVSRKVIEISQRFSLKMTSNIHEMGSTIPITMIRLKKVKK